MVEFSIQHKLFLENDPILLAHTVPTHATRTSNCGDDDGGHRIKSTIEQTKLKTAHDDDEKHCVWCTM